MVGIKNKTFQILESENEEVYQESKMKFEYIFREH